MELKLEHQELIERRKRLQYTGEVLKDQFIGLDKVIDEIVSLIAAWYLLPEIQRRPTVINLWGLTGSGKTALVQQLIKHLSLEGMYAHIDMGEFESDSASWLKSILKDDLEFFDEKSPVICLDEFQFARTVDGEGNEQGKDKLRVIWDLLDSGKIDYIPGNSVYYLLRADNCLKRITRAERAGVIVERGEVVAGEKEFLDIFNTFYFDERDRSGQDLDKQYFLSRDFIEGLFGLFDHDECSKEMLKERVRRANLAELKCLIVEGMQIRPATKTLDLSKSLIFVLGNLDEAYSMSHDMNPDISADDFYEQTLKINIADIKKALRLRFRPEQIARLGNNHIIYTSFNREHFRKLIRRELDRVYHYVKESFGWRLLFDEQVEGIIYEEGVFPTQGTRPVLTTIKNLVESKISNLVVTVLERQLRADIIEWIYKDSTFYYIMRDHDGRIVYELSENLYLKLVNLRRSADPEIQAHVAVHEAGHAVLAALTLRIIPARVVSRTASDSEGFCLVNFPKGPVTRDTLKMDIVISLGGYVAERIIFGRDHTSSGVWGDIQEASAQANLAIRKYAMGSDPIYLAVKSIQNENAFFHQENYEQEAIALVKECEAEAERLLVKNKYLLLKMAEYLTNHSCMDEGMIREFVLRYGAEEWINKDAFVSKENYYHFNNLLKEQLNQVHKEEGCSYLEVLMEKEM